MGPPSPPSMLLEAMELGRDASPNLMKFGLSREDAVPLACSSRGPWFMSKCRNIECALTNDYLAKRGLVSPYEIWRKTPLLEIEPPDADPHARWSGRSPGAIRASIPIWIVRFYFTRFHEIERLFSMLDRRLRIRLNIKGWHSGMLD